MPRALAVQGCFSDPVLVVDGALVDVTSTLYTAPSAVRELDYTVTVPSGSLLGPTTLTVGLGFPEKVTYAFSPTLPKGSMQIAAGVVTQPGVAPFAVTVRATALLNGGSASGLSNQTLTVTLQHLIML